MDKAWHAMTLGIKLKGEREMLGVGRGWSKETERTLKMIRDEGVVAETAPEVQKYIAELDTMEKHCRELRKTLAASIKDVAPQKKKGNQWEAAVWYGTSDPAITSQFDCYKLKIRRGHIWLRVYKDPSERNKYQFTSDQGANSDDSYSGALPPESNGLTLDEAQAAVLAEVKRMNRWN